MSRLDEAEAFLQERFALAERSAEHSEEVFHILRDRLQVRDEDVLVAGLLHDVWEDTPTEWGEIETRFGDKVVGLIKEVSHARNPTKEDYQTYHESLKTASTGAKLIKIADQLEKLAWVEKMLNRSTKVARRHISLTQEIISGFTGMAETAMAEKEIARLKEIFPYLYE